MNTGSSLSRGTNIAFHGTTEYYCKLALAVLNDRSGEIYLNSLAIWESRCHIGFVRVVLTLRSRYGSLVTPRCSKL